MTPRTSRPPARPASAPEPAKARSLRRASGRPMARAAEGASPDGAEPQPERRRRDQRREERRGEEGDRDGRRRTSAREERRQPHGFGEGAALRVVRRGIPQRAAHEPAHGGRRDQIQEDRRQDLGHAASRREERGGQDPERPGERRGEEERGACDRRHPRRRAVRRRPPPRRRRETVPRGRCSGRPRCRARHAPAAVRTSRRRAQERLAERGPRAQAAGRERAQGVRRRGAGEKRECGQRDERRSGGREGNGGSAREAHAGRPAIRRPRAAGGVPAGSASESAPRLTTRTSPPNRNASSGSDVTTRALAPAEQTPREPRADRGGRGEVEAARGVDGDDEARRSRELAREDELLLVSAGESSRRKGRRLRAHRERGDPLFGRRAPSRNDPGRKRPGG